MSTIHHFLVILLITAWVSISEIFYNTLESCLRLLIFLELRNYWDWEQKARHTLDVFILDVNFIYLNLLNIRQTQLDLEVALGMNNVFVRIEDDGLSFYFILFSFYFLLFFWRIEDKEDKV